MASITFGSFGDVITACNILITISKAFSDSKGSKAEYQKLITQLECLMTWDKVIGSLLQEYPRLKYSGQLRDLIYSCKDHLDQYTKDIEPFRNSLGQNPPASTIKQICHKLRWLSRKEEVSSFQRSIAVYNNAISGVLVASGIDLNHECHRQSIEGMKNLFEDVQHRFDVLSINQTEADDKFLNAVHNSNQSLILRHDRSHQMVQNLHDNILAQFKQLQLSVTTEREKKTISTDLVPVTSTMELNKLYVLLIMGLVRELAKLGLVGFYQLLQLMKCFLLRNTVPARLYGRCFTFQDAFLRPFIIDLDFVSFDSFLRMIEDNFEFTFGSRYIKSKSYYFEDKELQQMNLRKRWSSSTLAGTTVFMKVELTQRALSTMPLVTKRCAGCGLYLDGRDSIKCQCGGHYHPETILKSSHLPNWSPTKLDLVVSDQVSRQEAELYRALICDALASFCFFERIRQRKFRPYDSADWKLYRLMLTILYDTFPWTSDHIQPNLSHIHKIETTAQECRRQIRQWILNRAMKGCVMDPHVFDVTEIIRQLFKEYIEK